MLPASRSRAEIFGEVLGAVRKTTPPSGYRLVEAVFPEVYRDLTTGKHNLFQMVTWYFWSDWDKAKPWRHWLVDAWIQHHWRAESLAVCVDSDPELAEKVKKRVGFDWNGDDDSLSSEGSGDDDTPGDDDSDDDQDDDVGGCGCLLAGAMGPGAGSGAGLALWIAAVAMAGWRRRGRYRRCLFDFLRLRSSGGGEGSESDFVGRLRPVRADIAPENLCSILASRHFLIANSPVVVPNTPDMMKQAATVAPIAARYAAIATATSRNMNEKQSPNRS